MRARIMLLHLGKLPGATPCYSPLKSVGTRSGVAPGAPVGVLASWAVGAPELVHLAWPVLICQCLCRALSPQLRLKLGDMWGLGYPT